MLDKVIGLGCVVFVGLSAWAATVPGGSGLPPTAQAIMTVAVVLLLLGHMSKHLGLSLMASFFLCAAGIEWAFEQINISLGGFIWGDLRYGHSAVLGPHLGSVPILVPLLMAAILWPTYAIVNLALDGRMVVDPRSLKWWQIVWRCLLYGMVHSWYMFVFDSLCVEWGLYHWVGRSLNYPAADAFFGDPTAPRGWAIYVFVAMLVFSFVMVPLLGKTAVNRAARARLAWPDAAPIVFMGVTGVQMYLNPINQSAANIALWTLGFFAIFVGYRLVDEIRTPRKWLSPAEDQVTLSR